MDEILHQQKVNVSDIIAENNKPVQIAPDVSYEPERVLENNKMSEDEIEALLRSCGITGDDSDDDSDAPDEASEPDDEPSGGKLSQEDIEKLAGEIAASYEDAEAVKKEFLSDKNQVNAFGNVATETKVVEYVLSQAKTTEETVPFDGLMKK